MPLALKGLTLSVVRLLSPMENWGSQGHSLSPRSRLPTDGPAAAAGRGWRAEKSNWKDRQEM